MDSNLDTYEIDKIIDEAIAETDHEINEQFAGPQYQQYNPEQLSVMNLLRRAQQTPQGSSTLADLLRGAYSLPGTKDEIPPIPPEHLTIKDVYLQSIMFALRTAILATSPPARILTLARLMFDTPPPRTATELITTIAGIWGNAAKDIVDDAVIRAYRAVDYGVNKVAVPLMSPFLAFFASGAMATAINGRIGGSVLTVLENPQEVSKNTATVYKYADKVLMLKGQMGDDEIFVGMSLELIEYLSKYSELYEQGLDLWSKTGVKIHGEDFHQLLLSQWNSTIGGVDSKLSISGVKDMSRLVDKIRGELPLPNDLKQAMFDFFSGVKFDEGGGWTVVAGSAGSTSIPLPLVSGQPPVVVGKDGLSSFTPGSFFDASLWNAVFWKFWSDEQVVQVWSGTISENKESFFDNDDFLNKYVVPGNTVFSTNNGLKTRLISLASSYYIEKYGDEEGSRKLEQFRAALEGREIKPEDSAPEEDAVDESGFTNLERKFLDGKTSYDDFAKPVTDLVSPIKDIFKDIVLTDAVASLTRERAMSFANSEYEMNFLDPDNILKFLEEAFNKTVANDLTVASLVKRMSGKTNIEGDEGQKFLNAQAIGSSDNADFESIYKMALSYFTAIVMQEGMSASELNVDDENIVSKLKSLD